MTDFKWSDAEKKIARRAFDSALDKELAALLQQLKNRAAKAETPEDIWAIHGYLTKQRALIDRKYDYRYTQLIFVFGLLVFGAFVPYQVVIYPLIMALRQVHLFATLPGALCLSLGCGLDVLGLWWTSRLATSAEET